MRLTDLMPAISKPEDPIWTTTIMAKELGSLIQALVRRRIRLAQGDEKGAKAYEATARIEHADLIAQCHVIAEQMGWKMFEQEKDGLERFQERMKEIREGTL